MAAGLILYTSRKNPCASCDPPFGSSRGRVNLDEHLENVQNFTSNFDPNGKAKKFYAWMQGKTVEGAMLQNEGNLSEMYQTLYELNRRNLREQDVLNFGRKFKPSSKTSKASDISILDLEIELKNKSFDNTLVLSKSDVAQVFAANDGAFANIDDIDKYEWTAFKNRDGGIENIKSLWQKAFRNTDVTKGLTKDQIFETISDNTGLSGSLFGNVDNFEARQLFDLFVDDTTSDLYKFIKSR